MHTVKNLYKNSFFLKSMKTIGLETIEVAHFLIIQISINTLLIPWLPKFISIIKAIKQQS